MTSQGELFTAGPVVPGLTLIPEAVTPAEEVEYAEQVDAAPLEPFRFGQWEGKRLTASFGSAYDYGRSRVIEAPPLPGWLLGLRSAIAGLVGKQPPDFEQALVIRYDPGAGIGWHRDRPQYGEIIGLSLSAPSVLRIRRRVAGGFIRHNVHLPQRSLYMFAGEVREKWEHSIAPMMETRRSITLRTMRGRGAALRPSGFRG